MTDDWLDQLEAGLVRLQDGYCVASDLEVAAAAAIQKLRAELAAERELREREKDAAVAMLQVKIDAIAAERESAETYKRTYMELHKRCCGAVAEREALRAALEPFAARLAVVEEVSASKYAVSTNIDIEYLRRARAALNKG